VLAITIGSPGEARAATALEPCHGSSGVLCGTVHATLDRRLELPGTVSLHVEELPAAGQQRGVLFLLAGGPGQAATHVFDLADYGDHWRSLFPGYTLVTFDPRGTGDSGALRCQSLEDPDLDFVEAMAKCADAVGPAVTAYATRDHAEDVEAVRSALGAGKIALFGTSYGAKLALAYALAHPKDVERVLLDSALAPQQPDAFARSMLRPLPRALRSLCTGGFCKATQSLPAELAALANALQRKPLRKGPIYVDGQRLLSLAFDADVNAGVRAQLATIVAEARRGRPGLLLRLASPRGRVPPDPTFSLPLYIATTCGDPTFPWWPETSLSDREQAYEAAVGALPPGSTGPFGRWAAQMGIARYCSFWPPSGPGAPLASGPLPDVPALVLSGGYDMRTPTESARAIARLLPRGRLTLVPGIGHGVLVSDISGCAERAVRSWLGDAKPASCPTVRPVVAPVGRLTPLPIDPT
jgi:pimeloyl-ACP methyl ester carboxylesterase